MSAYRVDGRVGVVTAPGIWRVLDDTGRVVGYGTEAEDAARIARALAVQDAMAREQLAVSVHEWRAEAESARDAARVEAALRREAEAERDALAAKHAQVVHAYQQEQAQADAVECVCVDRMSEPREKECVWTQWTQHSDYDQWDTSCGHALTYLDGPRENGTVYCQYCGGCITIALPEAQP